MVQITILTVQKPTLLAINDWIGMIFLRNFCKSQNDMGLHT
jgi:hypothetical protein